ncbi:MAG: N-6 DNA methylase [Campylobacterota bacterium]|nr:N-6 DNA methylase [Campylobacterota bacterium]
MSVKLNLYEEDNLLRIFEETHNFIYANDGLSTQSAFDEFTKILFLKILDEKNDESLFKISNEELELINNGKISKSFNNRIAQLMNIIKKNYSELFNKDESIKIRNQSLAFIIKKLQNINFKDSTGDAKGLAFQKFLSSHSKGGRGQFFTPEEVIDFCVKIIQPNSSDKIIDPTCGSGGFLFSSLRYIENNYNTEIGSFKNNNLFGIDINKDVIKTAKMKLLLEEVNINNFIHLNSIEDISKILQIYDIKNEENLFDIVLTNPPFGTQGKITNKNILKQYDLGYKWLKNGNTYIKTDKILSSQVPDVLFIERCLQLLKQNGKLAIVLPNGILENMSLSYVRYYLKQYTNIMAIIKLPEDTFIPYGTGVKTSLLFLEKDNDIKKDNKIFFSKINKLGYKGNKNGATIYKKDEKGNTLYQNNIKIIDEDYSSVLNDYNDFKNGVFVNNKNSFLIKTQDLDSRFDYNYYSPNLRKDIDYLKSVNSVKLGDIVDIIKTKAPILKTDTEVDYIELSDINTYSYEIINSNLLHTSNLPSRASYEIFEGDIITAVAGNSIGSRKHATAYVTSQYHKSICTNGFRVLRNSKINPYYLLYFLKTNYFLNQVMLYRTGTAIPNISDSDFKNILIELPAQSKIDEIGNQIKEIFMLKEKTNNILNTLNIA